MLRPVAAICGVVLCKVAVSGCMTIHPGTILKVTRTWYFFRGWQHLVCIQYRMQCFKVRAVEPYLWGSCFRLMGGAKLPSEPLNHPFPASSGIAPNRSSRLPPSSSSLRSASPSLSLRFNVPKYRVFRVSVVGIVI